MARPRTIDYASLLNTTLNTGIKILSLPYPDTYSSGRRKLSIDCKCHCGKLFKGTTSDIINGKIKSCGCLKREHLDIDPGDAKKPIDKRIRTIFCNMKQRCYNKNHDKYLRYGGRGITICDEWLKDIQVFIGWAKTNGYNNNLTIDRIDNDKGYRPDNCRWISVVAQAGNRDNNNTYAGVRQKKNNRYEVRLTFKSKKIISVFILIFIKQLWLETNILLNIIGLT